jgi:hypothetical protein
MVSGRCESMWRELGKARNADGVACIIVRLNFAAVFSAGFSRHRFATIEKVFGRGFYTFSAINFLPVGPRPARNHPFFAFVSHHSASSAIHGNHQLPLFRCSSRRHATPVGLSHRLFVLPLLFLHPPLSASCLFFSLNVALTDLLFALKLPPCRSSSTELSCRSPSP